MIDIQCYSNIVTVLNIVEIWYIMNVNMISKYKNSARDKFVTTYYLLLGAYKYIQEF